MSILDRGFLYRRLGKMIPCVLPGIGNNGLPLASKYDVASARDVFVSAHYWRLFEFLKTEPKLVVDLGAHCGHFSVLCHLLLLEKFGRDIASYLLVEPVRMLLARAQENLKAAGLAHQASLHCALVGRRTGAGLLNCDSKNLLSTTVGSNADLGTANKEETIAYIDLGQVIPADSLIDVLKIDIEGSEQAFLQEYPGLLARTRVLLIELHGDEGTLLKLDRQIVAAGLRPVSTPIGRGAESMRVYVSDANP